MLNENRQEATPAAFKNRRIHEPEQCSPKFLTTANQWQQPENESPEVADFDRGLETLSAAVFILSRKAGVAFREQSQHRHGDRNVLFVGPAGRIDLPENYRRSAYWASR